MVIPLAVFALVAAGGLTAGLSLVANAQDSLAICNDAGTSTAISCSITDASTDTQVNDPSSIEAVVTLNTGDDVTPDDQYVQITYSVNCSLGGDDETTSNSTTDDTFAINTSAPVTDTFDLAYTDPDTCEVLSAVATLESSSNGTSFDTTTTGEITMNLEWTPQASSSTSSTTTSSVDVSYISGFGGKCIDDKGNSSSNGTKVIIWGCDHGDSAQGFTFTDNELQHNGKCVNDAGYGGSGTKVVMWSCNGGSNERWTHTSSDGEFLLSYSSKGFLCLDDPAFSTANRTQLTVYKCNNGGNQHWS